MFKCSINATKIQKKITQQKFDYKKNKPDNLTNLMLSGLF